MGFKIDFQKVKNWLFIFAFCFMFWYGIYKFIA